MGNNVNNQRSCVAILLPIVVTLVGTVVLTSESALGMTKKQEIILRSQRNLKKNEGPQLLPTTYANRKNDKEIFAKWKSYVGRWVARDESGEEIISVVLTPRLPRPGKDASHGTLAGFIPEGQYEGVLLFERLADETNRDKEVFIEGDLYKADKNLTRSEAKLLFTPAHQKPGNELRKKRLTLHIKEKGIQTEYSLDWVNDIDDAALSTVCIIAHRGLGFAGLDNTLKALRHAWIFGASGIEFDVTVPYTSNDEQSRFPLTNRLVVYHPPLLNQTSDIDRIPETFSPAKYVFGELENYWVPLVYVDPKVKWLSTDSLEEALKNIIGFANEALRRTSSLMITIGAPDDITAKFLSGIEPSISSPYFSAAQLSWTLEWTGVNKAADIFARANKPPSTLSFNLIEIRGSNKWPLMEWLFKDIRKEEEKEISKKSQALIFWTANDNDHFRGSVNAAKHLKRIGNSGKPGETGIMTDYPHRLAYWLATF